MDSAPDEQPATVREVVAERVRALGHQPLLTAYDDDTGERTELSYATLDNWASKAANLLVEELDAEVGDGLLLDCGGHWSAAVLAIAAWKVGMVVLPAAEAGPDGHRIVAALEDRVDAHRQKPAALLVCGRGMGGRLTGAQPHGMAFAEEVLAFADDYDDPAVDGAAPALRSGDRTYTQAELVAAATPLMGSEDRVATASALDTTDALLHVVVAPIVAGASAVVIAGTALDPQRLDAERVTRTFPQTGPGP